MRIKFSDIQLSEDQSHFLYKGKILFNQYFKKVLKFHPPGLAAVSDTTGWYHIDITGKEIYKQKYNRVFGYYDLRATVVLNKHWFHINEKGAKVYKHKFSWCGNFQEYKCAVRNHKNLYFHIDREGNPIYKENYLYAGDFYEDKACVRLKTGLMIHINTKGERIYSKEFLDLGVFHKGFATAKDQKGWHHIDRSGSPLYKERYHFTEPFYNGFALVENFQSEKLIINEKGKKILKL